MQNGDILLSRVKKLIENELGWGDSSNWVNQDFVALSKKINDKTGNSLSPVTLKRIWGKARYDGLPQVYTLNTLAKFAGYESWRDFIVKNETNGSESPPEADNRLKSRAGKWKSPRAIIIMLLIVAGVSFATSKYLLKKNIKTSDYTFASHTTINAGIPNSVVFTYDASKADDDSVIIQQSWDNRLRRKVSKKDHQATLIYYFPGYFNPKLIVNGTIVKEHGLLIKSNGWITALMDKDTPIYFKKEDVIKGGKMALSIDRIKSQNIALAPTPPVLSFCNVQDFGELYSDDFDFETSVKNEYRGEASVCQMTNIYLLCKGTAINIPLCSKGCESALNFFFTTHEVSGKKNDLSQFGVNFSSFVKVRIHSKAGKAKIYLNDKLAYAVNEGITRAQIIGIDITFHGTGSVDYVKLGNGKVNFDDEF